MAGRITLSTTDEVDRVFDKIEDEIEEHYGGKSAFWRHMIMKYDDLSRKEAKKELLVEKRQKLKREIEDLDEQINGLEEEIEERRRKKEAPEKDADELTKLDELKIKRDELKDEVKTDEQVERKFVEKAKKNGRDPSNYQNRLDRKLERNRNKREELEEVINKIEELEGDG